MDKLYRVVYITSYGMRASLSHYFTPAEVDKFKQSTLYRNSVGVFVFEAQ